MAGMQAIVGMQAKVGMQAVVGVQAAQKRVWIIHKLGEVQKGGCCGLLRRPLVRPSTVPPHGTHGAFSSLAVSMREGEDS